MIELSYLILVGLLIVFTVVGYIIGQIDYKNQIKLKGRKKMIFKKLKREFPQFANLQANRVSELTHAQRVQVAKAIFHGQNGMRVRHRLDMYQTMPKGMLKRNLYSALKDYYNE